MQGSGGWDWVLGSMRRFATAWENSFPADGLRDVVAALEGLIVRNEEEVTKKITARTTNLIGGSQAERRQMNQNIKDAYDYRSRVAHGEFVFDNIREWETAKLMNRAKGKKGNPFYDVNEVHRLNYELSRYFQRALRLMIDQGKLEIDWTVRGL